MKHLILGLTFLGAGVAISACSTTGPQNGTLMANAASTKIGSTTSTNEEGEEITCKRDYATGSRVKYTEICGTEEEWSQMSDANQKFLKDATGERAFSPSK